MYGWLRSHIDVLLVIDGAGGGSHRGLGGGRWGSREWSNRAHSVETFVPDFILRRVGKNTEVTNNVTFWVEDQEFGKVIEVL